MKKVLIVNANYYKSISKSLANDAVNFLNKKKIKHSYIDVPGIFEIPVIISKHIKKFDGFIALGCVIKGKTPHFNLISKATFHAIMKMSIDHKKPIGNGIITALNKKQAVARAGNNNSVSSKSTNKAKGLEAAKAVVAVLKNVIK